MFARARRVLMKRAEDLYYNERRKSRCNEKCVMGLPYCFSQGTLRSNNQS
jgi:hypothetical protein